MKSAGLRTSGLGGLRRGGGVGFGFVFFGGPMLALARRNGLVCEKESIGSSRDRKGGSRWVGSGVWWHSPQSEWCLGVPVDGWWGEKVRG